MYKYVFFDLDGTLTDPGIGITNSVMHALKKYNIEVDDRSQLYPFIGPPLIDSFKKYFDFSDQQAREAVDYYREYFSVTGLFENAVYDGVAQMLGDLQARGKRLIVATSKPDVFSVKILEHFDLLKYFEFVAGATIDEKRTHKDEVIEYALRQCGIEDTSEVIMVGDREYDVLGAAKFGIDTIGVLYGYGDFEELKEAGARYIVETPMELLEYIQ